MLGSISRNLYELMLTELGAATPSFNALAGDLYLHLVKGDFTPELDTDFTSVTEADFVGYTVRKIDGANRDFRYDPLTNEGQLVIPAPTGGLTYATSDVTNLPQTIYGLVLSDDSTTYTGTHAKAYGRLDNPPELTINLESFDVPAQNIRFSLAMVSSI